jgi:hypothetical protein
MSQGAGTGAVVTIAERRTPALRFEVTAGKRMVLRQRDRAVLFARADRENHGIDVYRTGTYQSPIPPLRSTQMRQFAAAEAGTPAWASRWAHRFLAWLGVAENGPLHQGDWLLEPRVLPPYCLGTDLVVDHPAAHLDWLGQGWNGVLPLHALPHVDAGRVRAYRKHARDRTIAPLLLWWISGIDGYLLLDGHSRLAAAHAEQISPSVLVLAASPFADEPEPGRTRAWILPGGPASWQEQAEQHAPGWPLVRRTAPD